MSDAKPGERHLTEEAIDLAIRLQSDSGNPVAIEMVRNWRARGPDHERVWAKVARLHGATGKLLVERRKAERRESLGLTRRNFMSSGARMAHRNAKPVEAVPSAVRLGFLALGLLMLLLGFIGALLPVMPPRSSSSWRRGSSAARRRGWKLGSWSTLRSVRISGPGVSTAQYGAAQSIWPSRA